MKATAQLDQYNIVRTVAEVGDDVKLCNNVIIVDSCDMSLLGKVYRGTDIGFTDLDYTKIYYTSNKIIIKMMNYLDEHQFNHDGDIRIKIGDLEFTEQMENGVIELEFVNETGKPVTIETLNENIRNGVITIE